MMLAVLVAAPAQALDVEKDAQKPARTQAEQKQAASLADEAAKREVSGEDVSYEAVLAAPDDIKLNYRYAVGQIRRGDVKGSVPTLERILLLDPKQHEVRLLYAIVLYRLDNVVEAKRELELLKPLPLPPTLRSEADKYLKAVTMRIKRTHITGDLGVGFEYDTNRNAAPASGRRLFGGAPVNLTGSSRRRDDTNVTLLGSVGVRRDLPYQSIPEVFGSFSYYQTEQTLTKNINIKAYSLQAGSAYRAGRAKLTPTVLYDHVQLAQSTFLRNRGGGMRLDYRLNPDNALFFEGRDVYQDYVRTRDLPTAWDRTGIQVDITAGSEHILNPSMKFGTLLGYTLKHAMKRYNAYDRYVAGINHAWLLGKGMFLTSAFTVNYDLYDQPEPAISSSLRKDTGMRANATLGAPLSVAHAALKDLVWTFTYEYYHTLSTLENYAYSNNKVATMLTYRWEVGL
jgi:hypothetical protein